MVVNYVLTLTCIYLPSSHQVPCTYFTITYIVTMYITYVLIYDTYTLR
jgi:hypothetical protein